MNANGESLTPFLVYQYKNLPEDVRSEIPEGVEYNYNDSGYMREVNFLYYIEHVVVKGVKALGIEFPIVLCLDNHTSHFSINVSKKCEELGIILVCLYPNSTHITQPLDVSVFYPLKQAWAKYVFEKKFKQTLHSITSRNFARHFMLFLQSIDIKPWVVSGFKACGIFPWTFENIDYGKIRDGCQRKKRQQDTVTWAKSVYLRWQEKRAQLQQDSMVVETEQSFVLDLDNIPVYFASSPLEPDLNNQSVTSESDFTSVYTANELSMDSGYATSQETDWPPVNLAEYSQPPRVFNLVRSEVTYQENPPCYLQGQDYFFQQGMIEFAEHKKPYLNPRNDIKDLPMDDDDIPIDLTTQHRPDCTPCIEETVLPENKEDSSFEMLKNSYGPTMFKKYSDRNFCPQNKEDDLLQRLTFLFKPVEVVEDCLPLPAQSFRAKGAHKYGNKNTPIVSDASYRKFRGEQEKRKFEKEEAEQKQKQERNNEKTENARKKALEEAAAKKLKAEENLRKKQAKLDMDLDKKLKNIENRIPNSKTKKNNKNQHKM